MTPEQAAVMIQQLVDCEAFEDVAKLKNAKELLQCKMELNDKLCHIGDSIVYKLVQWTKRLPFYHELPVAIHTQVVTLQCFLTYTLFFLFQLADELHSHMTSFSLEIIDNLFFPLFSFLSIKALKQSQM